VNQIDENAAGRYLCPGGRPEDGQSWILIMTISLFFLVSVRALVSLIKSSVPLFF
jgi:hypothetical protein